MASTSWRHVAAVHRARCFGVGGALTSAALVLVVGMTVVRAADAREAYAEATAQRCRVCHQSAAGGGELRPVGRAFIDNGRRWPAASGAWWELGADDRSLVRFAGGAAHILLVGGWLMALVAQWPAIRIRCSHPVVDRATRLDPWLLALVVVTGAGLTVLRLGDLRLLTGTAYGLTLVAKACVSGGLVASDVVFAGSRDGWSQRFEVRVAVALTAMVLSVLGFVLS